MSRQSLRSKKISSFYNFDYNINNTTADSQTFRKNNTDTRINTNGNVLNILEKNSPVPALSSSSLSIGSNVGNSVSIGFDNSCVSQGVDSMSIGNYNTKIQGNSSVSLGNSNFPNLGQGNESICIGSSNDGENITQMTQSLIIGNNNKQYDIKYFPNLSTVNCLGNNNKTNIKFLMGFNQDILKAEKQNNNTLSIGNNINSIYSEYRDDLIIGNDIKIGDETSPYQTSNTSLKNVNLFIGNNINIDREETELGCIVLGNNIGGSNKFKNSSILIGQNLALTGLEDNNLLIGTDSELHENKIISIGNFNGKKSQILKNNILIGNAIDTNLSNSVIINTLSTDYLTTETFTKFILRAPIRRAALGIGENKLYYDEQNQELLYSST